MSIWIDEANLNEFTVLAQTLLSERFSEAKTEWLSQIGQGVYSPRVDLAVGPFAIVNGSQLIRDYNTLLEEHEALMIKLIIFHKENCGDPRDAYEILNCLYSLNPNSRCFLAIEIENVVTEKHLMGGALNASVLGRVGIAIGFNKKSQASFRRLWHYFDFLRSVGKNTFNASNLLVITPRQLLTALS